MSLTVSKTAELKGIVAKAKTPLDVVKAVQEIAVTPHAVIEPAFPKFAEITDATKSAMLVLPEVVGEVRPTEPRVLEPEEIVTLFREQEAVRTVLTNLKSVDEDIKEVVRHHMDKQAEQDNRVIPKRIVRNGQVVAEATERDANGHYLLATKGNPERVVVEGTGMAYSNEYRESAAAISNASVELLDLYDRGEITREQYLALTKETRVYDETKVMAAMSKDPETYIPIIAAVTHKAAPSQSLFVRKA